MLRVRNITVRALLVTARHCYNKTSLSSLIRRQGHSLWHLGLPSTHDSLPRRQDRSEFWGNYILQVCGE